MEIMGKVPATGETVHTEELRLTVLSSDERQIKRVRVESVTQESREGED